MSALALSSVCNWIPFCHSAPKPPTFWAKSASNALDKFRQLTENTEGFQYLTRLSYCVSQIFSPFCNMTAMMSAMNSVDEFIAGVRIV